MKRDGTRDGEEGLGIDGKRGGGVEDSNSSGAGLSRTGRIGIEGVI
jgi:hypothetical protein